MRIERHRLSRKWRRQGEFRLCAVYFDHQALLQPVAAFGLDFECGAKVWRRLPNLAADGLPFLSPVQLPFRNTCSLEPLVIKPLQIAARAALRSEEHTSELQSLRHLVCRLPLQKK